MKLFHSLGLCALLLLLTAQCRDEDITHSSALSCPAESDPLSKSHPKSIELQNLMDDYTRKGLPGINLMVSDASGVFLGSSGMADIQKGIRMQPCHVNKIASLTKMLMATLTFRLQEEGSLNIDDHLTKWLTGEELKDIENADQVTLRDLMKHSTGIYDVVSDAGFYLQVLNDPIKHWEPMELLEFVRGKKADFEANSTSGYSNTNTLLLSMALNNIMGVHHSRMLHEKLFDPLGMQDTYYHWHDVLPKNRLAQGYFDLYHNGKILNLSNWNTGSGNGYGGTYSTVMDLALFMRALFVDKTILSDGSLNEMLVFNESVVESRKYLGVGLFKDFIDLKPGLYAYGHRGRDLAYSADLFFFPQQNIIMALQVNYGNDSDSDLKPVFLEFRDKVALVITE